MFNSGKKGKQKKNMPSKSAKSAFLSTIMTILKIGIPFVIVVGIIAVTFIIIGAEKLDIDDLNLDLTSTVCYIDSEGEIKEYEKISSTGSRFWVPLNKVPQNMQEAFISIEDERFRSHNGVDIKRTAKAVIQYIFDRDNAHGGSTITQQLVKNLTGNADRSPIRKIQEMWMAFQMERQLSKDQILELYVNTIYLAQGVNGVQTASRLYFDKDVSELSLAECASIAGITQTPALYDPFLNPENNKKKQEIVLAKMLELEKITQEEYDNAVSEELNFKKGNMRVTVPSQSYFTEQVIADVVAALVEQKGMSETVAHRKLQTGGYRIISTIDPHIQSSINDVFSSENNFPKSSTSPAPQGAIVVMDVHSGEVKGLYGGIGPKPGAYSLNRATGTFRQPGSSIKPLSVYAPAIDKGLINPNTIYTDKKVTFGNWSPKNSYSDFKGDMTIRTAVKLSVNTIAAQVTYDLGIEDSYDYLKNKFKISSVNEADKVLGALSLGGLTKGASVMDMTAAYSAFANSGVYNTPITFTKIIDNSGKVILKNKSVSSAAVSKTTAAIMNDLLRGVVTSGTGTAANISGYEIAGKTGTSDEVKDRWFVGYTPDYCAAVWYGYDTPKSMSNISGNPAASAWRKVMQPVLLKNKPTSKLDMKYQGFKESIKVCTLSGLLPCEYCEEHETVEWGNFGSSEIPTEVCSPGKHAPIEEIDPETAEDPEEIINNDANAELPPEKETEGEDEGIIVEIPTKTPSDDNSDDVISELENLLGN